MDIERWPIVTRTQLVRAFRPGGPSASQGPFRTLRLHDWVTPGVSIVARRDKRAAGRVNVFSVLNLDAARQAREGHKTAAAALARAARKVEASPAFEELQKLLSGQSPASVADAVEGKTREAEWPDFYRHLRALAQQTAKSGSLVPPSTGFAQWVAGTIAELRGETLVLVGTNGVRTALPRWLARAAHRDQIGDYLTVAHDRLDEGQMLVDALPGLRAAPVARRSPYGRHMSLRRVSKADAARLRGRPAALRILVPVTIDQ